MTHYLQQILDILSVNAGLLLAHRLRRWASIGWMCCLCWVIHCAINHPPTGFPGHNIKNGNEYRLTTLGMTMISHTVIVCFLGPAIAHLHQFSLNTRRAWLKPQITWQSEDAIAKPIMWVDVDVSILEHLTSYIYILQEKLTLNRHRVNVPWFLRMTPPHPLLDHGDAPPLSHHAMMVSDIRLESCPFFSECSRAPRVHRKIV